VWRKYKSVVALIMELGRKLLATNSLIVLEYFLY